MSENVRCVVDCHNILGEVPMWDVAEQALYWVDIEGKLLQRLIPATGEVKRWDMPERISSFALRENGGLIVAFASGIAFLDLDSGDIEFIARPEAHLPGNRFNEGKCDRQGRFWAGAMDDNLTAHTAGLYRIDPDRRVHRMLSDIGISNCFIWSRENDRFWFTDSLDKTVYTFDYAHESGDISNRQVFTRTTDVVPDGGTMDEEGYVWIALWDGWRIARFAPDGTLDREIPIPAQKPTSCMFGGPDLATLYITTASDGLSPDAKAQQPLAGDLFALDTGSKGMPEAAFKG